MTILSRGTFLRGDLFSEDTLIVEGGVEGNLVGHRIIVKKGGWVHGNVSCRSLSIESGGIVDGDVRVSKANATAGLVEQQTGPGGMLDQGKAQALPGSDEDEKPVDKKDKSSKKKAPKKASSKEGNQDEEKDEGRPDSGDENSSRILFQDKDADQDPDK